MRISFAGGVLANENTTGVTMSMGFSYYRGKLGSSSRTYDIGLRFDLGYIECDDDECYESSDFTQGGLEFMLRQQLGGKFALTMGVTPGYREYDREFLDGTMEVTETDTGANLLVGLGGEYVISPNWAAGGALHANFPDRIVGFTASISSRFPFGD